MCEKLPQYAVLGCSILALTGSALFFVTKLPSKSDVPSEQLLARLDVNESIERIKTTDALVVYASKDINIIQ